MNSSLCYYRGEQESFTQVISQLLKTRLPIIPNYNSDTGLMHFEYDGKCDGNTAHNLCLIIKGYVGLYK